MTDSLGDGNVLSRTCGTEVVRFHWTAESRLTALKVVGGDSTDFRYDASGRLVRQDRNGAVQAWFLWQGDNLLAELDATATGKVAEYSYHPGLDHLHALITGTTPYFAHVDGTGNVIALTDSATQSVQRSYDFGAWGLLIGGTDAKPFNNADRARFKGALWLGPGVDVYFMRARWYEPKSGRFLSEDPIGLAGGINPYVFAFNDPVNRRDPSGLCDVAVQIYENGGWRTVGHRQARDGELMQGPDGEFYRCVDGNWRAAFPQALSTTYMLCAADGCPYPPELPPEQRMALDAELRCTTAGVWTTANAASDIVGAKAAIALWKTSRNMLWFLARWSFANTQRVGVTAPVAIAEAASKGQVHSAEGAAGQGLVGYMTGYAPFVSTAKSAVEQYDACWNPQVGR